MKTQFYLTLAMLCLSGTACAHQHGGAKEMNSKTQHEHNKPLAFLQENIHLLPKKGNALDLAMGSGQNAILLAKHGLETLGIDISPEAIKKAQDAAQKAGVHIELQEADLNNIQLKEDYYDVIVMTYYMQRSLYAQIKKSLKKGGLVLIETFNEDTLQYEHHPRREWTLHLNELLQAFQDFKVLRYQAINQGPFEAYSSILAQKI